MPDRIDSSTDRALREISRTASLLHERGFGESFFGNISVMLKGISPPGGDMVYPLTKKHPDLIGSLLLITRTGSTMREIGSEPLDNIGVYRIEGDLLRLLVGTGPPSTELEAHLAIHSKLSLPSSSVVHCHIGALLPLLEGSEPLPDWVRSVRLLKEGSLDLARASGEVAEANTLIIWRGHGIVSVSRDPSGALELIERAVSFAKNDRDHTVL